MTRTHSTPTQLANQILQRTQRMNRMIHSIEQHIAADQADALATGNPGNNNPHNISDPTGNTATSKRLAPFNAKRRAIETTLNSIIDAIDRTEAACHAALSVQPEEIIDPEPRCPGWTDQLRTRFGGCGNIKERYKRADNTEGVRDYCVSCRKAEYRDKKNNEAA